MAFCIAVIIPPSFQMSLPNVRLLTSWISHMAFPLSECCDKVFRFASFLAIPNMSPRWEIGAEWRSEALLPNWNLKNKELIKGCHHSNIATSLGLEFIFLMLQTPIVVQFGLTETQLRSWVTRKTKNNISLTGLSWVEAWITFALRDTHGFLSSWESQPLIGSRFWSIFLQFSILQ